MFGVCACNKNHYSCQLDVTSFVVIHDFTDGFIVDSHLFVPAAVDDSCDELILRAILVANTELCARSSFVAPNSLKIRPSAAGVVSKLNEQFFFCPTVLGN